MQLNRWKNALIMLIVAFFGTRCGTRCPEPTLTFLVSVASDGTQQNDFSDYVSISPDGRYIGFVSEANNLVNADTNTDSDVFVHDIQTGTTIRVSIASDSTQGNSYSYFASISAGGRYVAFGSDANNLVNDDTNGEFDIFIRDIQTSTTSRVSVASDGTQGNGSSSYPSISADGRYVAFNSDADNLVGDDMNNANDIFVRDLQTGTTTLVSLALDGALGNRGSDSPVISADGNYVAFNSYADNLVSDDTNSAQDVFIHSMHTHTTSRVSVISDTMLGDTRSAFASISADGRYVAFQSGIIIQGSGDVHFGGDIWQPNVFVYDVQTDTTTLVSVAWDGTKVTDISGLASISADGRYVSFGSASDNLVNGDNNHVDDVFVRDMKTNVTMLVSLSSDGVQGNDLSSAPSISADGRSIAFHSAASNLVCGDTNRTDDILLRMLGTPTPIP